MISGYITPSLLKIRDSEKRYQKAHAYKKTVCNKSKIKNNEFLRPKSFQKP